MCVWTVEQDDLPVLHLSEWQERLKRYLETNPVFVPTCIDEVSTVILKERRDEHCRELEEALQEHLDECHPIYRYLVERRLRVIRFKQVAPPPLATSTTLLKM